MRFLPHLIRSFDRISLYFLTWDSVLH